MPEALSGAVLAGWVGDPSVSPSWSRAHIAALAGSGLAARGRAGRVVRNGVTPAPLSHAASWIGTARAEWDERLVASGPVPYGSSLKLTCFAVPPSGVAIST
jgi:hypothetical protein